MAVLSDKAVLRLFMLNHKVCLPVVRSYFDNVILDSPDYNNDFITYLQKHKHDIYHLRYNVACCQCVPIVNKSNNKFRLFRNQYDKLYTMGDADTNHIVYNGKRIIVHCCCGVVENRNCSTNDLDLTTFYALLKTCSHDRITKHEVWLDKIVEERNNLCHTSSSLTETKAKLMWDYLEGAILGLASHIPPTPIFRDKIGSKIELLWEIDFGMDTVKPIIDTMKIELAELNNNMANNLSDVSEELKNVLKDHFSKAETNTDSVKVEVLNLASSVSLENTTNNKRHEQVLAELQTIKGIISHESKGVSFSVGYSMDSSLSPKDYINDTSESKVDVVSDDKPEEKHNESDVCIHWRMKTTELSEEERATIKDRMVKAAKSLDCWFPHKINHIFDGSLVIGSSLPEDIFKRKESFEYSIRKFLDTFVEVSGISGHRSIHIDVEMHISKSQHTVLSHFCRYEFDKTLFHDESVQATPLMSDVMTDASEDDRDALCYYKVSRNPTSLPPKCGSAGKCVVLCWRYIDSFIFEQIKQHMEEDYDARYCFITEILNVIDLPKLRNVDIECYVTVSREGYIIDEGLPSNIPIKKIMPITVKMDRFNGDRRYKSECLEKMMVEIVKHLGPICYRVLLYPETYTCNVYPREWKLYIISSISNNSKVLSIISMIRTHVTSQHKRLNMSVYSDNLRSIRENPCILPIPTSSMVDVTRNVKQECIIPFLFDSDQLPESLSTVACVDVRNPETVEWMKKLDDILGAKYWIASFKLRHYLYYRSAHMEVCGEYLNYTFVLDKAYELKNYIDKYCERIHDLNEKYRSHCEGFLFVVLSRSTASTALTKYLKRYIHHTIIVLLYQCTVPYQLSKYQQVHASNNDSDTYKEIIKCIQEKDPTLKFKETNDELWKRPRPVLLDEKHHFGNVTEKETYIKTSKYAPLDLKSRPETESPTS